MLYDIIFYTSRWFDELLVLLCNALFEKDKFLLNDIVKTNRIHKSTSTKLYPLGKDPIFSIDKKYLVSPVHFKKADFYIEQCLSADRAKVYACELLKQFKMLEKTKIDLSWKHGYFIIHVFFWLY